MPLEQFIQENYWWILLAALWSIPWKGVALWKAAQQRQKWWFIALLVINTFAILEITYLFYFSKPQPETEDNDTNKSGMI